MLEQVNSQQLARVVCAGHTTRALFSCVCGAHTTGVQGAIPAGRILQEQHSCQQLAACCGTQCRGAAGPHILHRRARAASGGRGSAEKCAQSRQATRRSHRAAPPLRAFSQVPVHSIKSLVVSRAGAACFLVPLVWRGGGGGPFGEGGEGGEGRE